MKKNLVDIAKLAVVCPHCENVVNIQGAARHYPDADCVMCGAKMPRAQTSGRNPKYCDTCRKLVIRDRNRKASAARRVA